MALSKRTLNNNRIDLTLTMSERQYVIFITEFVIIIAHITVFVFPCALRISIRFNKMDQHAL